MSSLISITAEEFRKLADYIKAHYGIHLKDEKRALVNGRLQSVLAEHGFHSFSEYFDYVLQDKTGEASITLMNKITTNHTFFMREAEHFYYFRDTVLPQLQRTVSSHDLRIWSAGCSTGEEPYTLAMLIDEFFGPDKARWDTKILATDLSNRVLEIAQKGVYTAEGTEPLPAAWKHSYLSKLPSGDSAVVERIKNEVIFRRFNLMNESFPFKKRFHVIFCRNVMIYFNQETKTQLVDKFYDLTEPGGYLFIGHSESLGRDSTRYKFIMPAVYRKE